MCLRKLASLYQGLIARDPNVQLLLRLLHLLSIRAFEEAREQNSLRLRIHNFINFIILGFGN